MSDELAGRSVGVTIKYGKGYEETWATFRGTPTEVKADIESYFDIDGSSLTLHELVANATQVAHAYGRLGAQLGATSIPKAESNAATPDEAQADPWAANAAANEPEPDKFAPLFGAVEAATDVTTLKHVWADNQGPFSENEALLAAYKAKGKALAGATK